MVPRPPQISSVARITRVLRNSQHSVLGVALASQQRSYGAHSDVLCENPQKTSCIRNGLLLNRRTTLPVTQCRGVCQGYGPQHFDEMDLIDASMLRKAMDVACTTTAHCEARGDRGPFTIVDLDRVAYQYNLWRKALPTVKPYFAVKCNSDPLIMKRLHDLGAGFDCASQHELQQVLEVTGGSSDIILAHPVKTRECVQYAAEHGIDRMTFDSLPELDKIVEEHSEARPILRISVSGFSSLINLNSKFGADVDMCRLIFHTAAERGIKIYGLSFHIGSGVEDVSPMARTLEYTRKIYDYGKKLGHPLEIIDIGGGFLSSSEASFMKLGQFIERSIHVIFEDEKVKFVAEPGRFLVTDAQVSVVRVNQVMPKTFKEDIDPMYNVFINDGVYGSFNYVMTEGRKPTAIPLKEREGTMLVDIWGPTCCSLDILEKDRRISSLMEGDWMVYPQAGAYSNCLATTFNGFPLPKRIYIGTETKTSPIADSKKKTGPRRPEIFSKL